MAVRVKDYKPVPSYWFLIFWNGVEVEENVEIEIRNFKLLHQKSA